MPHLDTRPDMLVRPLEPADAPQYRALMLEAYELAADAFTSTAAERATEPMDFWIRRIDDPKHMSAAFGAFVDDRLVGTVTLEFSARPKTRHKAHVIGMYVAPEARGMQAGRKLLALALDHARARDGVLSLVLTVTESNAPAIGLYRSAGFEVFGVEPMAIRTPDGFKAKVHMWHTMSSGQSAG